MKQITHTNSNGTFTYNLPFKIKCTVTGVEKTYTSVEYINKRIDKAGSLDKMLSSYVSKDAKRAAKAVTAPVVQEEKKDHFEDMKTQTSTEAPAVDDRPIAKRDAKGLLRNSKGHIVKKGTEDQYQIAA